MRHAAAAARALALAALLLGGARASAQAGAREPQPYPQPYPPDAAPPPTDPSPPAPAQPPAAPAQASGPAAQPPTAASPGPTPPPTAAPAGPVPPAAAAPGPQPSTQARTQAQSTGAAPPAAPPASAGTGSAAQAPPFPAPAPAGPAQTPASALGGAVPGAAEPADRRAHALERTLVERGGLLLEPGRFELVPEIGYAMSDHDAVLSGDGSVLEAQTRRFGGGITLRLGLPLRLQAEGEVPFAFVQETPRPPPGGTAPSVSGGGLGDVRLGLTWHVLRSGGGSLPDVLVNGFYKTRSGGSPLDDTPARVPLGSGIEQLGGGLSVVKALDPVVLLAAVSAAESVPRRVATRWLDPRAELSITTSLILAVSPETSLSFGLEQAYSQDVQVDRRDVPGTNRAAAVFDVGFATLASRAGLLQVTLGIGLTDDVPRFQVGVATPLQF